MKKRVEISRELTLEIDMKINKCTCGSQKPPDECCGTAKLVNYAISMPKANHTQSDGLAISSKGEILRRVGNRILPLIGHTTIKAGNVRKNARLKITALGDSKTQCNINPDLLLLQFDHVLVIDTNTEEHDRGIRCATGIFRVEIEKSDKDEVIFGYDPAMLIEFINPEFSPERTGWAMAINIIKQSPYLSGKKIAIVTDHDVNSHRALNLRRESIISSCKVPKNVRLIYGASDRGSHAINKLMRLADGLATLGLKRTREGIMGDAPWMNGREYLCERFRASIPDAKNIRWAISETNSITYRRKE